MYTQAFRSTAQVLHQSPQARAILWAAIKTDKHTSHFSLSYKPLAQRAHLPAQTDLS